MPTDQPTTTLNDAIPGSLANDFYDSLQHQRSRLIIKDVVQECIGSSEFATRVESIHLKVLESDPAREKLKKWVIDIAKSEVNSYATAKKDKDTSRMVGIGGLIVGIVGVAVAIIAIFAD